MAGDWSSVRLRDISELITKGTTPTTLGMSFVAKGVNFIKSESITAEGGIDSSKFAFIDEKTHAALRRSQIEPYDLLFSMAGVYLGKTAMVPPSLVPANTNQAVAIIRLKKSYVNPRFVAYYLRNPSFNIFINNLVGQSAQPNINLGDIGNLEIVLPPLEVQNNIGYILGTLDDKIEVNRRMNETLEAIARTMFKSWFIDFDPVRAKTSGEPPESICRRLGLTPGLFALFPDRFQDSELGEIPEGWNVQSLYDCAEYINGLAFRNEHFSQKTLGLPVIKIGELKDGITAQTKFTESIFDAKYRVTSGDILFSWSGSPDTSIDIFVWAGTDGWLNQHIFKIAFKGKLEKYFVYYLLRHLKPEFVEIARNKQTTGLGHVTAQDLKRLKAVFPGDSALREFNVIAEPLFQKVYSNHCESITLIALRDALLPKLLSGELRVPAGAA